MPATVAETVDATAAALSAAGVPTPEVDAEWLVAHVLGLSRTQLALARGPFARNGESERLRALVARRARREPLAYVLGEWGFRRLTLRTDARALVPRPETEIVVERCLRLLRGRERPRVLDVGTGSGAIALSIADEHPGAQVVGVDVSGAALALAAENAARTGLDVALRAGGPEAAAEGWDLVVSNPPYVSPVEVTALEPEVRDWEPRVAVVGEGHHAAIARLARTALIVLEVAPGQAEQVAATLAELGYEEVTVTRDLAGLERVVEARRP